jgi:hypothetical protein
MQVKRLIRITEILADPPGGKSCRVRLAATGKTFCLSRRYAEMYPGGRVFVPEFYYRILKHKGVFK